MSIKGKSKETENRVVVAEAGEGRRLITNKCGGSYWSHKNVLKLDESDDCMIENLQSDY